MVLAGIHLEAVVVDLKSHPAAVVEIAVVLVAVVLDNRLDSAVLVVGCH